MRAPFSLLPLRLEDVSSRSDRAGSSGESRRRSRPVRGRSFSAPMGRARACCCGSAMDCCTPTSGVVTWNSPELPGATAPPGDGIPATRHAAALGAGQRRCMRCGSPAFPMAQRERTRDGGTAHRRPRSLRAACGARPVGRRAATAGAGAGLGAAPGSPVPRRADREPRSRRDARDRDGSSACCTRPAPRS